MNKKGQFSLDDFNPIYVAFGLVGGIISLIVMSQVEVGLIWRIGAFIGSSIASYAVVSIINNR